MGVLARSFGILVIKSGFIAKFIGVLLLVAALGYVAMSAGSIAFPAHNAAVERVGKLRFSASYR